MNLSKQPNICSLSNKEEISVILSNGKKVNTKFGPVYFYSVQEDTRNRIAILLKKKIGKAYYRNYIKRTIRFYIRSEITLLGKYNRVIFLYRYMGPVKYYQLKNEYNFKIKENLILN
ncbi:MAG: ribonuclease P protein component [Calditrichaeota bacterium]|nr:MAG: ribonuclease P protein component [Calditrichota bacterium]MBL1205457.1 ribonuclease P protein component [Calditrichota bacterium]